MAPHSSILVWKIPWTEELQSGGLQFMDMTEHIQTFGELSKGFPGKEKKKERERDLWTQWGVRVEDETMGGGRVGWTDIHSQA